LIRNRIHPAWIVAGITFGTLFATAGFRSAPSVLILPLEEDFGWRRDVISLAVAINVLLYGLTAPFAAAFLRIKFGDYAAAFYVTGIMCVITSYFVLQITLKEKVKS
jgi:SNF family Na+-dependent transporter